MPRDRLRRLVSLQPEADPLLRLVHSSDVYGLINALEDGALRAHSCDVFVGEPLLYFFYGRPSFRVNSTEGATSLEHYLPVCLLFRAESVAPIKRVFPFDSGGFHNNFYDDALHRNMKLDDFELDPTITSAGRAISLFFGTVGAYLQARPLPNLKLDPAELEAVSYHTLVSQRLSNNVDNRASAIEIQTDGELALAGNVDAIILPGPLYDSPKIHQLLKDSGIMALPYPQIERQRPGEYVTKLFDICYEYYRRTGIFP